MVEIIVANERLILLAEKVVFWPAKKLLLIADLHLGKSNHFRRSGIAVPNQVNDSNMERLIGLLKQYDPERVIFLGDLFHSHYNAEWEVFGQVLNAFAAIKFELVQGNHDIMSAHQYYKYGIHVYESPLPIGPFLLSHEPLTDTYEGYNLAGHIHPAVRLRGKGRQGLRLPCFYFGASQGLLPAFGAFTGLHTLTVKKEDRVFAVVESSVVEV